MDAITYEAETKTLRIKDYEVLNRLAGLPDNSGTSLKALKEAFPEMKGLVGVIKTLRTRGLVTLGKPVKLTEHGVELVKYGRGRAGRSKEDILREMESSESERERRVAQMVRRLDEFTADKDRNLTPMYWWAGAPLALVGGYWAAQRELGEPAARESLLKTHDVDGFYRIVQDGMTHSGLLNRRPVVSKAIECHRRGDYDLSVPVFLIQAEGVARDTVRYFCGTDNRANGSGFISWDKVVDVLSQRLGEPREYLEAFEAQGRLDRDDICHGRSLDYATRWQSFISLLYLYSMVDRYSEATKMARNV